MTPPEALQHLSYLSKSAFWLHPNSCFSRNCLLFALSEAMLSFIHLLYEIQFVIESPSNILSEKDELGDHSLSHIVQPSSAALPWVNSEAISSRFAPIQCLALLYHNWGMEDEDSLYSYVCDPALKEKTGSLASVTIAFQYFVPGF